MKLQTTLTAAALLLAACASGPDYRQASHDRSEGYSEQVIEKDRYRIQYRLDEDHVGKAQDYALLRAAELTMQQGYDTFEVVGESSEVTSDTRPTTEFGVERTTLVTRECGLLGCTTNARPVYGTSASLGTARTDDETIVTIEIIMSNLDASTSARHYDASQVAANIRSRL